MRSFDVSAGSAYFRIFSPSNKNNLLKAGEIIVEINSIQFSDKTTSTIPFLVTSKDSLVPLVVLVQDLSRIISSAISVSSLRFKVRLIAHLVLFGVSLFTFASRNLL